MVAEIAEIGAGIQPQVEDLPQVTGSQPSAVFVDEADDRNPLLAERAKQVLGHGAKRWEVGRSEIGAARQVVNSDRNLPARAG